MNLEHEQDLLHLAWQAKKAKTVATDPVLQDGRDIQFRICSVNEGFKSSGNEELRAWVVNLERRPDRLGSVLCTRKTAGPSDCMCRWKRVATMLKKVRCSRMILGKALAHGLRRHRLLEELPWLSFERFLASDGSKMTIPEEDRACRAVIGLWAAAWMAWTGHRCQMEHIPKCRKLCAVHLL